MHDLGGTEGFGPVVVEADEPVFHADWERRAFGVTLVSLAMGINRAGQFRHSIERMDPVHYLGSRYYEHWLTGVATRLVEAGVVTVEELEARAGGAFPLSRPAHHEVDDEPGSDVARYAVGDAVRVRDWHPRHHTRCPRYVRGKQGAVVRVDGAHPVPDADGGPREPTYGVRFEAGELWADHQPGVAVHVDLWQRYLEEEA